jgi:membrane-bound lytic murein transglycosylase F
MKVLKSTSGFGIFWIPILFLLMASCQHKPAGENSPETTLVADNDDTININDWTDIAARGRLNAVLKNSPTGYFVYRGRPMGFEYELLSRFCRANKITLNVILESDVEKCFTMLNEGKCDIIAHNLTITKDRRKNVEFTMPQYEVRQMLVQRLPDNYEKMKDYEIEHDMIRDPIELIGREVHVRKNSSYSARLMHLSEEIGGDIKIIEEFGDIQTEELMDMVAGGDIDYTVADEDIAKITASYYPNIDVNTALSFPTRIAWAVNKKSPVLLEKINQWLREEKRLPDYNVIYDRYFNDPKGYLHRVTSTYSSIRGNKLSKYDNLIKKYAKTIDWDWRLLAALIYRESHFSPDVESWAGAIGLMQLMPETARIYGAKNIKNPEQNIRAGTKYIKHLQDMWKDKITDKDERLKFVLASFNVGPGHVEDAVRLAKKYEHDPAKWSENVAYYLLKKSEPTYYEDPASLSGYCRGEEPVTYVKEVLKQYDIYKQLMKG